MKSHEAGLISKAQAKWQSSCRRPARSHFSTGYVRPFQDWTL